MSIPFTQYMMPDGRRKSVTIDRPPHIERIAHEVIADGCEFDCEMLRDGNISLTCVRDEEILVVEVCPNGPPVLEAVDRLVVSANEARSAK